MPKTRKKPVPLAPGAPPNRPSTLPTSGKAVKNSRPQTDNRWQRTKRHGWDSR